MTEENISELKQDDTQASEDTTETPAQAQAQPHNQNSDGNTQNEAQKNKEGWQRTLAEFQNYKRRMEREQKDISQRIALETLAKILPIMDDFERALGSTPSELEGNPWMNGVSLIQGKFRKLLEEHNVTTLDPVGEVFNPNHHQAISMADSDEHKSGHVIETLQKGYISGETLLRPALVRVAN